MMKRRIALILSMLLISMSVLNYVDNSRVTEAAGYDINDYLDMSQLEGYATVSGYGMDTVTGGGNATPKLVTTTAEFTAAVSGDEPAVVLVSGTIKCMTSGGSAIDIGSNKTIVGIDENACLNGGINISGKSNIIVSNLIMKGCLLQSSTPDDVINVQNYSHHIWFNHLDISDGGDGNLDIKCGSDYITVSWCKFYYTDSSHNHRLSCLIGSGAGDHDDTDYNRLHVTYHHNWFADYVKDRQPRVMYGRVHVYNNYYTCSNNSYCVGVDCYGAALIENCYFYKVNNPHQFMYDTNTMPASITARGNIYDQTSGKKATGDAPNKLGVVEPLETVPYSYWLDEAEDVPEIVKKYAGPTANNPDATPHPTAEPTKVPETTAVPTARPAITPSPTPTPLKNDNPATYVTDSSMGKVIQLNGQSSDGSNGYMEIDNPFAGKDFSETPKYSGKYPVWTKGITISYWQYIPSGVSSEGVALSFNGTHRAIRDVDYIWYKDGETEGFQNRFEDNGGSYSLIREGNVSSGFQISTYGSVAFSEDDMTAVEINPYSGEYGYQTIFQDKNYFYYFANGGVQTNSSGKKSALVSSKNKWHHVVYVITNDNIVTYVDGTALSTDYFNYWGKSIAIHCNGQAFNLGTGWSLMRRYSSDSECYKHGISLLDFISLENTTLTVGGKASIRSGLGQDSLTTPSGVKIGKMSFYDEPLTAAEVKSLYNGIEPETSTAPTAKPTATPTVKPTATPTPTTTVKPTATPTVKPTATPTPTPTVKPTATPTVKPTATPTVKPTATPTATVPDSIDIGVLDNNGVATVDGGKIIFNDPDGYENGVILENPFIGKDTSNGVAISFWLTPAVSLEGTLYDYTSMILAVRSDKAQMLKFDLEGTRQLNTYNGAKLNYWKVSTSLEKAREYFITLVMNEDGIDYYIDGKSIGYLGYSKLNEEEGRTQMLELLSSEGTVLYAGGTSNLVESLQTYAKHKIPKGTVIRDVKGYVAYINSDVVNVLYENAQNEKIEPTPTPTVAPTATPTVKPTATPTAKPTATPTVAPTATPTMKPTATPTVKPTATPTAKPTATPTVKPTATPTVKPTATPTVKPTVTPTATPTVEPTATPTAKPTATPTVKPTVTPTVKPTATPTVEPTATPTVKPTATPTVKPTVIPTVKPTATPTVEPTATPTVEPTAPPTEETYLLGDVDGNGVVEATDALLVLKHAAKLSKLDEQQQKVGDANFDSSIDAIDALMILKYAAKLIEF